MEGVGPAGRRWGLDMKPPFHRSELIMGLRISKSSPLEGSPIEGFLEEWSTHRGCEVQSETFSRKDRGQVKSSAVSKHKGPDKGTKQSNH